MCEYFFKGNIGEVETFKANSVAELVGKWVSNERTHWEVLMVQELELAVEEIKSYVFEVRT